MDFQALKNDLSTTPAFILDKQAVENNLKTLNELRSQSGCQYLYSMKALPFSSLLELVKPVVDGFSASSLFEVQLIHELFSSVKTIHLTTPGLRQDEFPALSTLCSHISFNSLTQYQRFSSIAKKTTSMGLRLNPKLSFLNDDRFDPCRQHSKLGVSIDDLWQSSALDSVQGLLIHNAFACTDYTPIIKSVEKLRSYFGKNLAKLDWLNLGGGYLFNQIENHQPFVNLVRQLKSDFKIEVFVEPGKAIVGNAGYLMSTVLDSFISGGKTVVILDTTINHNPEVFEYQRQPELLEHDPNGSNSIILAGSSCLAGDVFGEYQFNTPLNIGDRVVFSHVGAYSLIKANRFNGINLPDIYLHSNEKTEKLKQYTYGDYRQQWLVD
jgi:carboxynorspermidine decarboxylase